MNIEGACFNQSDQAILNSESSFGDRVLTLGEGCIPFLFIGQLNRVASCLSALLVEEVGLTVECSDCFGDFAVCLGSSCLSVCNDGFNQGCEDCLETNGCMPNLVECAGPVDLSSF